MKFNLPVKGHADKRIGKEWLPETDEEAIDFINNATVNRLKFLGFGTWDEPDMEGNVLYLFPEKWYNVIPNGTEVIDIFYEKMVFNNEETDDDTRFGMLSFGIYRKQDHYFKLNL